MTVPILDTKLYAPPTRSELVSRKHLIELLESSLDRKLTLVSAPAGFGKTTLVSQWLQQTRRPTCWLSLDRDDNDPLRFWRYVVAALRTIDATLSEATWAALESGQQLSIDVLVTTLINDLATVASPLALILDDYHLIEAESIHRSMNFLLDHLPPQLHLIVTTRVDPPFLLPRRRSRAELAEIRTANLCFSVSEATEFLNARMRLDLSPGDVLTLKNRTEGWIVGLQLAAVAIRAAETCQVPWQKHEFVAAFAGDDRYIGDYLVEEVLHRQSQRIQRFLLETSILDRFCAPLCDAVIGWENSEEVLDNLDRNNLFTIPLDTRRHWYRYHHLFADLLRRRLGQVKDAQDVAALHLRASRWYEQRGFVAEAISHALLLPNLDWATTLVERHAPDFASRGEAVLVHGWLEVLPEDKLRSSPYLCLLCAGWDPLMPSDVVESWLSNAEKAWDARVGQMSSKVDEIRFHGWMASTRAWLSLHRGDSPQQVVEHSRQTLDRIPEDDLLYNQRARSNLFGVLGHAYWRLGDDDAAQQAFFEAQRIGTSIQHYAASISAARNRARIAFDQGHLRQAAAICREGLHIVVEATELAERSLPAAGGLYIILGHVFLEWGDLEQAEQSLSKGLEMAKLIQTYDTRKQGYMGLARLGQTLGDMTGALDLADKLERLGDEIRTSAGASTGWAWLAQGHHDPGNVPHAARLADEIAAEAAAVKIRCWSVLAEHDRHALDLAERLVEQHRISLRRTDRYRPEQLALVRMLVARWRMDPRTLGETEEQSLLAFLSDQLDLARRMRRERWAIEILVLQAMVLQTLGDIDRALLVLRRALNAAEQEGFILVFADEGTPMARLLYQAIERDIAPAYAGRVLAAFPEIQWADRASSSEPGSELVEVLSPRELEVLQLVAEGLSNRQIAQKLFISPNTVRVHTSRIYGKLGVSNRTRAVAKARGLGILPLA